MALSFLQFSRLSPRERMLRGLSGQLSPTFGLEVGAPRGQLGIIPLRGLGRDGAFGMFGEEAITAIAPATALLAPVAPSTSTVFATPLAPSTTISSYTSLPSSPLVRSSENTAAPASVSAPASAPVSIGPASTQSIQSGREDLDYSGLRPGQKVEGDVYQVTEYEDDQTRSGQEVISYEGDEGATEVYDRDTFEEKMKPIKRIATRTDALKTTLTTGWVPWAIGGVALAGVAFWLNKSKRK